MKDTFRIQIKVLDFLNYDFTHIQEWPANPLKEPIPSTGNALISEWFPINVCLCVHTAFKAALAEADFQRREYIRVKEGKKHKTSSILFSQHSIMLPGKQLI